MIKKIFIFLLPFLLSSSALASESLKTDPVVTTVQTDGQYEALPSYPPSEEVNYVEESELARKMIQAKKAENAKTYDSYGGGITIIAMCIVIGALVILSILFLIFGRISSWFLSHKKRQTSKVLKSDTTEVKDTTPDTGDVIAAISAALAQHFATDHDKEDTILTIKRMRKAYSPWNSKIYNMRHEPNIVHNHPNINKK